MNLIIFMTKTILSTIVLSTILLTSMIATAGIQTAYADTENISLRSDSSNTMLVGPVGTPFPNALTPADFAAASSGPNAFEISNHNAWVPHLTVDSTGKYIGTANVNPNHFGPNFQLVTALYAVDFEITSTSIDSATLDIHFLVDNNLGWTADQGFSGADNEGVFINGQPVVGTTLPISVCGFCSEHSFTGLDISGLVNPGTNTLYVYASDYGQPSGLQYLVDITVESTVNVAPQCDDAQPSQNSIWPPNHEMVNVGVNGVTDPDGDTVTITVIGIQQDEKVSEKGSGNTAPDGIINGDSAQVRAERSGNGDGRVYEISFEANDGNGGTCTGSILVGVPHDKKNTPIDSEDRYDSTS